jgi:hypothetical protein
MNSLSLLGTVRRKLFAAATAQTKKPARLKVENLEDRAVPATIPNPVIDPTSIRRIENNAYSPDLAVNPTNPDQLVSAFIRTVNDDGTRNHIEFKFSTDGGQSWDNFFPTPGMSPNTPTSGGAPLGTDPKASNPEAPTFIPYTHVGTPSVAFDRFNNVFLTYTESNDDNSSGRLILRKFAFANGAFNEVTLDTLGSNVGERVLYQWVDADQAYNPVVAIDVNNATFQDPSVAGGPGLHTDALAAAQATAATTRVFVVWNTNNIQPQNSIINPNVIRMAVSDDGGLQFGATHLLNNSGNAHTTPSNTTSFAQPKVVFTQGRAGVTNTGGQMVISWSNNDPNLPNGPTILTESRQFTAAANVPVAIEANLNPGTTWNEAVAPASGSGPHTPGITNYTFTIPAGITRIDDIQLTLGMFHNALEHAKLELIGPGGTITLFNNAINANGDQTNLPGTIDGTNLGFVQDAFAVGTTFADHASRSIFDGNAASPYTGDYRPFNSFTPFYGDNPTGTWTLRVTDFRADEDPDPAPGVRFARLKITQSVGDDNNGSVPASVKAADNVTGARTARGSFTGTDYANKPASSPNAGIGPSVSLAVDNTLGAFSKFQNRVYMAYTNGTQVLLKYSDNGGLTWNADPLAGPGPTVIGNGFNPKVAVDPATGTVVVSYYSAQYDASGARSAMMIATSIDAPAFGEDDLMTFSTPTFVNSTEQYFDQIRQQPFDFEPVTSNGATAGPEGYGNNLGLVVRDGRVNLVYAGNLNQDGLNAQDGNFIQLRTQNMAISAGPRIVSGHQGPVIAELVTDAGTVNDTFDPVDGRRQFSGFLVTFDRPVDPATFDPSDITIKYRTVTDDPAPTGGTNYTGGLTIQPVDVVTDPLSGRNLGSTQFLVELDTPQSGIGTYSYSIAPTILDRIRASAANGPIDPQNNQLDQDGDGDEGETAVVVGPPTNFSDVFAVPNPVDGVTFQNNYTAGSLPIVVTGPRVIGSQVRGQAASSDNLVMNATTNSLDVEFDRVMNTATFTAADILRITGPNGDIPLTGLTILPITGLNGDALGSTTANSKFYRISFTQQRVPGSYRIQFGSHIQDIAGNEMDADEDAGVSLLQGDLIGAPNDPTPFTQASNASAVNPVTIPANGTATVNLNVATAFSLRRALATITVIHSQVRDLEGRLIGPNGDTVLLFANSPATGNQNATAPVGQEPPIFTNITFSDFLPGTPIQSGGASNGTYLPVQPLASRFNGDGTFGTWKLEITNKGAVAGRVEKFQLTFDRALVGTGLGEEVADQSSAGFRIFLSDPENATARNNWTPVGPTGKEFVDPLAPAIRPTLDGTVGRVSSIAVDPSDPSGNTVYVAGASGGVWRTTNFLTRDADGPNYIPLTDFGPNDAINVGSLTVHPHPSGDPLRTTVIVGTGSSSLNEPSYDFGNDGRRFDGVGVLLSEDAGKTWRVLDSLNNFNSGTNRFRDISDPLRDHRFVGTVVNKVVVEPTRDAFTNLPIIYAAVGQGSSTVANVAGLYRSRDGGRTWKQIGPVGVEVSDFLIGEGSGTVDINGVRGRPQKAYMAVEGQGVFRTVQLNVESPSFTLISGGTGRPTVLDIRPQPDEVVLTNAPTGIPNGGQGKITLAAPAFVPNGPLANLYYQDWLYAVVSRPDGTIDGLYMTKDAASNANSNWTQIKLFENEATRQRFTFGGGNHSLSLAVDPNNPNIVYLGSDFMLRIDTTFVEDAYNLSLYQHSNANEAGERPLTTGGAVVRATNRDDGLGNPNDTNSGLTPTPLSYINTAINGEGQLISEFEQFLTSYNGDRRIDPNTGAPFDWNFINLVRNPYAPLSSDITLFVDNVVRFTNTGQVATFAAVVQTINGVPVFTTPGVDGRILVDSFEGLSDFSWVSQIVTTVDPLTGKARIIYGTDEGVATFVNEDDGRAFNSVPGFDGELQTNNLRNGDLQIARLYSGDVQPSVLAADVANAMFYGAGRRQADTPASAPNILTSGDNLWVNPLGAPNPFIPTPRLGPTNHVIVDPVGDGVTFILRRINDIGAVPGDPRTEFFQVSFDGQPPISRTIGLFLDPADADGSDSQWSNASRVFAVNPFNRQATKVDRQVNWGLLMGSDDGRVYRSTNTGATWDAIGEPAVFGGAYASALAFGAPLPNVDVDHDFVYVGTDDGKIWVTTNGGGAASEWTDISAGLDGSEVQKIVVNPQSGSHELYAVTSEGVYRMADSLATGATWVNLTGNVTSLTQNSFNKTAGDPNWTDTILPTPAGQTPQLTTLAVDWRPTYAPVVGKPILYLGGDGGVFKATENGTTTTWARFPAAGDSPSGGLPNVKVTDLDLSIGNINPQTGRVSTTGIANILLATTLGRGSWAISLGDQGVTSGSGPKVFGEAVAVRVNPADPLSAIDRIVLTFDKTMEPLSFTPEDVVVKTPAGATLPTTAYSIAASPGNQEFTIDFSPNLAEDGTYTITIGPDITDGPSPIQPGNKMNQDGDAINGEVPADQYKTTLTVGQNDMVDFVRDTYDRLLAAAASDAQLADAKVKAMEKARTTALFTLAKELLLSQDARRGLVQRLFQITGGANLEIGNLLPAFVLSPGARDAIVSRLTAGQTTPEKLIVEIMTGLATSTSASTISGLGQTYYNNAGAAFPALSPAEAFLTKVYQDVFRLTTGTSRIQFAWLPASVRATQLTQVDTPQERFAFVNSLIRTRKKIQYFQNGDTTTPLQTIFAQDWIIQLAYAKYLGRQIAPTSFVTAAELTAGRTLLTTAQAANQLQTSERLLQKVFGSMEFFSQQTQGAGLPDAGLHTNRSWVEGVYTRYVTRGIAQTTGPAPLATVVDTHSQRILDLFETQRNAFVTSFLNSASYRDRKIDEYYSLVWGTVAPGSIHTSWKNGLTGGTTYATLVANQFGSAAFYNQSNQITGDPAATVTTWARAVIFRAFNEPSVPAANDPRVTALVAAVGGTNTAAKRSSVALSGVMNSDAFRNVIINQAFQTALSRPATANELTAYRAFLASNATAGGKNKWERILLDILATGNVTVVGQTLSLPREFWEIAD